MSKILNPEKEFELPYDKTIEGNYLIVPKHNLNIINDASNSNI